jgi:uncharacterized membrane protein YkgB
MYPLALAGTAYSVTGSTQQAHATNMKGCPQYPVFGIQGASWFLGASEWLFGALLLLGLGNKKLGILGAAGSCVTFIMTFTILPFMPDGWNADAGGFPAMQGNVAFLMKDLVLFAVSFYLLKQDVERVALKADSARPSPK